jgi:two-component system NtrC family sensor kinase
MPPRPKTRRSSIGRRLAAAFGAVLALFAVALLLVVWTLARIADAERDVDALDHAKHAGHMAAAEVREQYIHQAHTLINWDASHLDHYNQVQERTQAATDHLRTLARTAEERVHAEAIAELARQNDAEFRKLVVPAVGGTTPAPRDASVVKALGDRLESVVDRVVALNEQLNRMFELESSDARARAEALRHRAKLAVVTCFGLAIALASGVGLLLTHSIVRPVSALQVGASRVGSGDLSARIDTHGHDEFAELAAAFNKMTGNLARHQEELVRTQKLAAIGQVAAGIAHEINNPLGVILGYVKLLSRRPAMEAQEELQIIEDEACQCQRIVQGLLDLARPPRLKVEAVDLAELARESIDRLDEAGKLGDRRIVPPSPDETVIARGDASRLRQVILNILVNALEASPPGGLVAVTAEARGGEARLAVKDSGPGIAPDVLAHVFDPFFTTKRTGTGLGLAIVHSIVEAHGGRIEIVSEVGQGVEVTLHLPVWPNEDEGKAA